MLEKSSVSIIFSTSRLDCIFFFFFRIYRVARDEIMSREEEERSRRKGGGELAELERNPSDGGLGRLVPSWYRPVGHRFAGERNSMLVHEPHTAHIKRTRHENR